MARQVVETGCKARDWSKYNPSLVNRGNHSSACPIVKTKALALSRTSLPSLICIQAVAAH